MRILDLARKDLLQIVRDRRSAFFLVVMPILFTLFFVLIFGSQGGKSDPRLPVGWVDRDTGSTLSTRLLRLLEGSTAIRPVPLDGAKADKAGESVRDGKLAATVIVPQGFAQTVWADQPAKVTVIMDANSLVGQAAGNAIDTALTRLLGGVQAARISAQALEAEGRSLTPKERQAYLEGAVDKTIDAWREPPLRVFVELQAGQAETGNYNATTQLSPGMLVQFAIYGLMTSAAVLVLERKSRALQRLLTTPIRRWEVIAGHTLAMFVVVFLQGVIVVAFGQLALHVNYMRQPLAILLVVATFALWVASLGLLIGALSKTQEQVVTYSLMAMFIFSALGGAWFSLEATGKAFAAIGHLTPAAWAMDGFQNILVRGLGLNSVLLPAGIVLAYALLFFALAVWRFRFE